jgi:hypothetical protein
MKRDHALMNILLHQALGAMSNVWTGIWLSKNR